ncbi:MAG: PSD1 domain-containing protein [Verrucomicrobia subdivision 3 bacterium]|nr:PSD1 domain-containing protein [Limisphaerales bacterium]
MKANRQLANFLGWLGFAVLVSASAAEPISYNRDVRPILSDSCFHCHGPDQKTRKGKFRLDVREDAVAKGAIVPGKPEASEFITRIFTENPEEVMPPAESHKTLTTAQKELLRRWIASGAKYEKHWAYVPPTRSVLPPTQNPIDALIRQRLRGLGLNPAALADRRTLARRLHFDLVGLPPKPEIVEAFFQEKSPDAVSRLIEQLMASPQYGERMAIGWLDVVRFADTIGYHSDTPRNIWPYRDYVIKAFNENKPFDQFTRDQLAGDLLPASTREQKVASAFNRLLLTTEEGGAQPKDYEARMLTDRVRAVSSVWLGQTIGCAQCHDHKFDPIKQRDFYALGAFFADIQEPIIGAREPGMLVPDDLQSAELGRLDVAIAGAQKEYDLPHPEWANAYAKWQKAQMDAAVQERRWTALTPVVAESASGGQLKIESDHSVLATGKKGDSDTYTISFTNMVSAVVGFRIETLPHDNLPARGPGRAENGNFVLTEVTAKIQRLDQTTKVIAFTSARADLEQVGDSKANGHPTYAAAATIDGNAKDDRYGWAILPEAGQPHQLVLAVAAPLTLQPGETLTLELAQNRAGHLLGHFRVGITTNSDALQATLRFPPAKEISDLLLVAADQRDEPQQARLYAHFKQVAPETAWPRDQLAAARKAKSDFERKVPRCLVSVSASEPRTVRLLPRGNFLIETGEIMQPALPPYLVTSSQGGSNRTLTRLDLADWLVARDNPLTARVVMNRLWKQFFGVGLSKVVDDLGAQGELPPNQPLLDWLACEFMDSGWDVKHMVRLIVNSEAYQRTSVPSKKQRSRDPLNRELAGQSRWRLDAELVRDNALAVSGLLVGDKIGGPSVKPYQPDGYWENLNFPVRSYDPSMGSDQYRRGLYVWWQRSYLHPSMVAFDAPTREECAAERNRSNIPQQALVLLNDPTYIEAARALAVRMLTEGGGNTQARLTWAWRQVLSRTPRADELKTMEALLDQQLAAYRADPAAAQALLKIGQSLLPQAADSAEVAAWTNLARVLLNLHETITRS